MPKKIESSVVRRNEIVFHLPVSEEQWESAIAALFAAARKDLHYSTGDLDRAWAEGRRLAGVGVRQGLFEIRG